MFEGGAHGACILRQVLSRNQELTNSARMTGEPAPGSVPPPPPQCWGCRHRLHHATSTSPALGLQTQATPSHLHLPSAEVTDTGHIWISLGTKDETQDLMLLQQALCRLCHPQTLDILNYLKMRELFLCGGSWQDPGGPDPDYKNEGY